MTIFTVYTKSTSSGAIEKAMGDALSSFFNYTVMSFDTHIRSQNGFLASLLISTTLYCIVDAKFMLNSNNPATMFSNYAAGRGDVDTLLSLLVRSVAQAMGAAASVQTMKADTASPGAASFQTTMADGKGTLPVDKLAVAQLASSFLISAIGLYISTIEASPSQMFLISWIFTLMIILALELADVTGIHLNPATRFGEDLPKGRISVEHFFVYWLCPITGAILAGWAFRIIVIIDRILRIISSAKIRLRMR